MALVVGMLLSGGSVVGQGRTASAPTLFRGGALEASGVVAVPGSSGVLIVDDGRDRQVFWMELDGRGVGAAPVPIALGARIPDPEDITSDGTFFYVVGSQSRGGGRNSDGLVRFRFDPPTGRTSGVERLTGLEAFLVERVDDLRRLSRGRTGPLNIEGMTWDAARRRLLLGLRSPLLDRGALLVSLRLTDLARPLSATNVTVDRTLIRLELGGLAVRGMGYDPGTSRVLIIGGGSTDEAGGTYRLFEWDGASGSTPRDLGPLRSLEKPEGVTRITIGGKPRTMIVFDLGGYQVVE